MTFARKTSVRYFGASFDLARKTSDMRLGRCPRVGKLDVHFLSLLTALVIILLLINWKGSLDYVLFNPSRFSH